MASLLPSFFDIGGRTEQKLYYEECQGLLVAARYLLLCLQLGETTSSLLVNQCGLKERAAPKSRARLDNQQDGDWAVANGNHQSGHLTWILVVLDFREGFI
jgi:hypothetical protein